MSEMKPHPAAELFPMFDEQALQELADDIRTSGLKQAITTLDGMILDGRNRYEACKMAGVEPRFKEFAGVDPLSYVISLNLKRRHLDTSQRTMIAAELATMRQGTRTDLQPSANLRKVSQQEAAKMLSVSERGVTTAHEVRERGSPELVAAVKRGEMTVTAAAKTLAPVKVKVLVQEGKIEFPSVVIQEGEGGPPFEAASTIAAAKLGQLGAITHPPVLAEMIKPLEANVVTLTKWLQQHGDNGIAARYPKFAAAIGDLKTMAEAMLAAKATSFQ